MPTILDIMKTNGTDKGAYGLVEEAVKLHPELQLGEARTIKGTGYKTLVRTKNGSPQGGSFRKINSGSQNQQSTFENRLVETFTIEPRFEVDRAAADRHEDGAAAYLALEASGVMEGETAGLCTVFYYGQTALGNADAFPGLVQSYDATNMAVDAGGTTDNACTSVWFLKFGPRDVQWVWGGDQGLTFSPVGIESVIDPNDSSRKLKKYVQTGLGYPGLAVHSVNSAARIKKVNSVTGLTGLMMKTVLRKFRTGTQPDVCLMNKDALEFYRQSFVTALNPDPVTPTSIVGLNGTTIPIRVTDSIVSTEPLAL